MAWEGRSRGLETVNRVVVSGLVFGPVEFTEPDRGPAHARFCLSQEKPAGSRRVEHRFHCVAFGPVAMAVAASLAPGVAVVLEGELAEARAASFLDGRPRRAEAGGQSEIKVTMALPSFYRTAGAGARIVTKTRLLPVPGHIHDPVPTGRLLLVMSLVLACGI